MKKLAYFALLSAISIACGGGTADDLLGGPRTNHAMPGDEPAAGGGDGGAEPSSAQDPDAGAGAEGGGGGDAATPANAFSGAPAYEAKTGPNTIKSQGDHPFPGGNPAKQDCMTSQCHGAGGEGPRFLAGGTVYNDVAGTTPAPQVEVRLVSGDGTAASVYTDANGNFYLRSGDAAGLTFPAKTGARDGASAKLMVSAVGSGACNSATCHGGPTGVIHVP